MTLREQLMRDEGYRRFPYVDTVGKITIGVGRNLTDRGVSHAEVDSLLDHDIAEVEAALRAHLPWTDGLDEARRGVLLNMAFNLGLDGLLGFHHLLAAAQTGDWRAAAIAMLQSRWANQVGVRAQRLARQMETGEWT